MNNLIKHLNQLKELYISVSFFVVLTITIYNGYNTILEDISKNRIETENTQMLILKVVVRGFERNHICNVSNQEWDEYILNYSTLFDLKIKYKELSEKANWLPIKRNYKDCE